MRRWIRCKGQAVDFGRVAQRVANHARFDKRRALRFIDIKYPVAALRQIEHDRDVDGLTAHRRTAASRENRHVVTAADRNRRDQFIDRRWHHYAYWRLP